MKNILDNHHRFEMCIHVLQSDDHITHKHLPNKMIILLIEQFVDFSGGGGGHSHYIIVTVCVNLVLSIA